MPNILEIYSCSVATRRRQLRMADKAIYRRRINRRGNEIVTPEAHSFDANGHRRLIPAFIGDIGRRPVLHGPRRVKLMMRVGASLAITKSR